MTDQETLVVMAMLGLSRAAAAKWVPTEKDVDVVVNMGIPAPIGRAEVLQTEKKVIVRGAPSIGGEALGFWVPGPGYDLWGVRKTPNDAREWCLLTGHGLEGWCASQYVRRV